MTKLSYNIYQIMNRDLEGARQAYAERNVEMAKHAHTGPAADNLYTEVRPNDHAPLKGIIVHECRYTTW